MLKKKKEKGPETDFLFFLNDSYIFLKYFNSNHNHFVIKKKRKRALKPDSFYDSDIFLNILILIITSLAIHYSQNVFGGFSILVCIRVQVCFRSCIFHIEKLRVHGFLFLVFLHIKTDGKNRLFL